MPDTSFLQHRGTLDLSWNSLSGTIPAALAQCAVMVELLLTGNQFTGTIPPELSRLENLTAVDLSSNFLNGTIPPELGNSLTIQGLNFAYNKLTGGIPAELGNIASLALLNLTGNMLTGPLPATLGNLTGLSRLDLSNNDLSGDIPAALANLVSIVGLNLAKNKLTGTIAGLLSESTVWHQAQSLNLSFNSLSGLLPADLGILTGLAILDLRNNNFNGHIPDTISGLAQLNYFDISNNHLVGLFPAAICDLRELTFLNMSYNQITGRVPDYGSCVNFTSSSFLANPNMCGEGLKRDCPSAGKLHSRRRAFSTGAILGLTIGCAITFLGVFFLFSRWRLLKQEANAKTTDLERMKLTMVMEAGACMVLPKSKEPLSINVAMFERPLMRLTLADILQATNNFCKTNIIGDGGFGTVYKATLSDGRIVAIKKLGASTTQGTREFLAEMETLGKVKHQNLVPLLGYCSFGEEKLLVYEYMVNGSLDLWLRNRADAVEVLDWAKRFKIATGSAKGLAFLHHGFIPHIIHRDIKASNVLLDEGFEARVADFGLARLISAYETHVSTDIAGTFGYIPPEYGQCGRSTTRGDVYSYGIILLELLTGKEPTGKEYDTVQGGNLVGCVRQMIKLGDAPAALDPVIANGPWKRQMLQVLHVAHLCTAEDPVRRPTMQQVVKMLKDVEAGLELSALVV
jgi:Leucine-rich repeat (LRR) protein